MSINILYHTVGYDVVCNRALGSPIAAFKLEQSLTTDVIDKQFLCSAEASRFSVPAYRVEGVARRGGQDWAPAHRRRRLGLDHPEHGAKLGLWTGPAAC